MELDKGLSSLGHERVLPPQGTEVELHVRGGSNKLFSWKRAWIILFSVLALGVFLWSLFFYAPAAESLKTQVAIRGNLEKSVTAIGKLEAIRSVDVGAQVSGQLQTLSVEIGGKVNEGQLIAEIDPASVEHRLVIDQAELSILKAQRTAKKAHAALKETNVNRQRALITAKSTSQSIMDQADADLIIARADLDAIEAQIRKQEATIASDKVDLGYTKIYAPFSGTVISNSAKQGQTLNANQMAPTIVTIADLTTMVVRAQVSEADVSKLKIGMDAYFTLIGDTEKRYFGKLRQIQPVPNTDNNVVLYNALFEVPNNSGELMISMSAQVFFLQAAENNALLIPTLALGSDQDPDGYAQVHVAKPDGSVESRRVEVGLRNRVSAQIKKGLVEGESVVIGSRKKTVLED